MANPTTASPIRARVLALRSTGRPEKSRRSAHREGEAASGRRGGRIGACIVLPAKRRSRTGIARVGAIGLDDGPDGVGGAGRNDGRGSSRKPIELVDLIDLDRFEWQMPAREGFDALRVVEFGPLIPQGRDRIAFAADLGAHLGDLLR